MRKINFKRFKTASDIQIFLESSLPINSSIPDVFSFLIRTNATSAQLYDNKKIDTEYEKEFEQTMVCWAPSRRSWLIFTNEWHIFFHFNDGTLMKIEVQYSTLAL
jgi:hypothetical protein